MADCIFALAQLPSPMLNDSTVRLRAFRWLFAGLLWLAASGAVAAPAPVVTVKLEGAVSPASAEHLQAALDSARRDRAGLVVLLVDTPGGLESSMRTIIKAILASPVPVAAFVTPAGARAASAGTFILYASHVAAMSPGTNVGAATPVAIGGNGKASESAGKDKAINDAAAYIRSLAGLRGRNADWAERAVRQAASLDADAALKLGVVDLLARDLPELLHKLDGRTLQVGRDAVRLQLGDAAVREYPQSWRLRLLSVLSDPGIALLLVMLGLAGLFLELSSPGLLLPGVLGAVSLLLGLYALQMLPLNFAGIALLLLGVALIIAELFVPSGLLAASGALALVAAAVMLMDSGLPGTRLPPALVIGLAALLAAGMAGAVALAMRSRRRPVSDASALMGATALVIDPTPGRIWVSVQGEHWHGECTTPLAQGQEVRVVARHGLTLQLAPTGPPHHGERK